jgi:hypothetical protein
MPRTGLAIILVVLASLDAFPQQLAPKAATPTTCSFSEIYRKDGWTIPGLPGVKVKGQRAKLTNMPGVFVTVLIPRESEAMMTDIWCPPDHSGRLEMEDQPIRILDLWSFDFSGRVFAYGISYGKDAMQNGIRVPLGAASAVMFYDLDGSGHFTVRRWARWPFMPDFIPDWARNGADASPSK